VVLAAIDKGCSYGRKPDYKQEVELVLGRLSQMLPGFRVRESQKQMMMTIVDVLSRARTEEDDSVADGSNIGVIEAPTGTGKSLAVALPSLIVARATGRKVVLSSATVALQEQLLKRICPFWSRPCRRPSPSRWQRVVDVTPVLYESKTLRLGFPRMICLAIRLG